MAHADKRTPATDALETLGMIHFKPEKRDAIHLAVDPVVAGQKLRPAQPIGIIAGVAYSVGTMVNGVRVPYHGIVDPFLAQWPVEGDSFWFVMAPHMVTSLRHVWSHSDFPDE